MTHEQAKQCTNPTAGGLVITKETVVSVVLRQIDIRGLDETVQMFDALGKWFGEEEGWTETVREVNEIFRRERERLKQEKAGSQFYHIVTMNGKNANYTENANYEDNPRKTFIT